MIRRILIIIIMSGYSLFSQNIEQDLLSRISKSDTFGQIEIYNRLAWKLRSNRPQKAIEYGNKAIQLINKIDKPEYLSKTFNFMGVIYRNSGDYSTALFYYTKALNNAVYYSDSVQIAYSHNNLGGIYRLRGNNALALENMLRALNYFESSNNKSGIGFCTINIGIVYLNQGNYKKSLEYLKRTLELRKQLGYLPGIALTVERIAVVYCKMGKYSLSMKYYQDLLIISKKINDLKGIAACYEGLSEINYLKKDYKTALINIKRAKNLYKKISDHVGLVRNYGKMALIYARLKNFNQGNKFIDSALVGVKKLNIQVANLNMAETQSEFYEIQNDYKKALYYHKKLMFFKDSVFAIDNSKYLDALQSSFELRKKADENILLRKESNIRLAERNYLAAIVVLILIISVVAANKYRTHKILTEKLKVANATKDKFLSIIAHDLRNPFNTSMAFIDLLVKEFKNLKEDEKIEILNETKNSFSRNITLLENLLEWSLLQRERVTFAPENTNLKNIISEIAGMQKETANIKNIKINLDILDITAYVDPNMIKAALRNLISNAIKFTPEGGTVNLKLFDNTNNITIEVEDSGVGICDDNLKNLFKIEEKISTRGTNNEPGTGLGLILCKDFAELHGGKLTVKSKLNEGSTFKIILPKNKTL